MYLAIRRVIKQVIVIIKAYHFCQVHSKWVGKRLSDMCSIKNGLKGGGSLLPLLFNFALEYSIRRVQVNQDGTHHLLVYADDVNELGRRLHTIKKNTEALVVASKQTGLEANADKIKYMVMFREQNARQSHNIKIDNISFVPEGKRPLGRPRHKWQDNIKMDLQAVGSGGMDWIKLAWYRDRWQPLVNVVMNLQVPYNAGNFLTS